MIERKRLIVFASYYDTSNIFTWLFGHFGRKVDY